MKLKITGKILLELPPVSYRILRPFIVGHLLQLLVGRDGGVALPLHSEGSLGISDTEVIVRTVCKYVMDVGGGLVLGDNRSTHFQMLA